jgi:23S rRNA pseudouridine2605 synthase|tara:strand:- start:139747 stop:140613 length:867 start_codon:yes stop_codon:yes gene_type:complete
MSEKHWRTPVRRPNKHTPRTPEQQATDATEKLQKVLARAGMGSRRALETIISEGRVSVDGTLAKLGDRVSGFEKIQLDGRNIVVTAASSKAPPRVIMYNKPEGEVCTRKDPEGRKTIFDNLPKVLNGRWVAVGRLDINTTGLILLTTDGDLANKLMHPSSEIDREYRVRIFGKVDRPMIDRLLKGVELEDGIASFTDITLDEEIDSSNRWITVTLMEGRNREVRRLWESQDVQVSRLKRVRFGPILLPSKVARGRVDDCTDAQIKSLVKVVTPKAPKTSKAPKAKNPG